MPLGGFSPLPLPLGGSAIDGLTAAQHARLAADLAAMVRTSPFACLYWDRSSVSSYASQAGIGSDYAPTPTVNGTGDVTFTWDASYKDAYDNTWPTNIKKAQVTCFGPTGRLASVEAPTTNSLRVRTFTAAGTPDAAADFFMVVY